MADKSFNLSNIESLLTGPSFEFHFGHGLRTVTVHQGIFKDISDPLNSMMTNKNFKEGAAGKIQHLDTEFTFELVIALCEFAYTGGIIQAVSKHRELGLRSGKTLYTCSFDRQKEFLSRLSLAYRPLAQSLLSEYLRLEGSAVLFFLADLYILAEKWLVKDLQALCLTHIHAALIMFDLSPNNVHALVSFVDSIYHRSDDLRQGDKMRDMLVSYVAARLPELKNANNGRNFQEVLLRHSQLGHDLVFKMHEVANFKN